MRIFSFRTSGGRCVFSDWYKDQSVKIQAKCETTLKYLRSRTKTEWKRPQYDSLSGNCSGLGEIRFYADRIMHRLVGFSGPATEEYTILVPAREKGDDFEPRNTCQTAHKRIQEVMANPEARICEIDEDGDE